MIVEKTLPLLAIFFLGYILKKFGIFESKDSGSYSKLIIYVVVPALAMKVFATINIDRQLILLPIAAIIFATLMLAPAFLIGIFVKDKGIRNTLYILFPTLEGGGIAYPIMLMVFGEVGLSRTVLFDIGNALFLFTVVYIIASRCNSHSKGFMDALHRTSRTPVLYAIALGIILNIIGFTPAVFLSLLDTIFASLIFVILFMLGIDFKVNQYYLKLGIIVTLAKTFIGLSFGLLIVKLFGFTDIERTAVLVMTILPSSILTVAYAKENKMNVEFMANVFSLAIPLSLIVITILLSILK
ncbi:MAG: AEC family transporter [bacterium]